MSRLDSFVEINGYVFSTNDVRSVVPVGPNSCQVITDRPMGVNASASHTWGEIRRVVQESSGHPSLLDLKLCLDVMASPDFEMTKELVNLIGKVVNIHFPFPEEEA